MNFLRLQFSEKTAIRDFVNLTGVSRRSWRRRREGGSGGRPRQRRGPGGGGGLRPKVGGAGGAWGDGRRQQDLRRVPVEDELRRGGGCG